MHVTPDLLTFADGSPVGATAWPRRRKELYDAIIPHEYGGMPPVPPEPPRVILRAVGKIRHWFSEIVYYHTYEVRIAFPGVGELPLTLSVWRPPGEPGIPGAPGVPVLLDGDGCWRYLDDEVVRRIVARGNIAASFDRTQVVADNKEHHRQTGLYRLFPDATFGALAAWAWGFHRCVDALLTIGGVRGNAIAITGHSRGGKTALLAGATDERIAITNPNDSGTGGAGLNRLKAPGSEVIDHFHRSGNTFWFGQGFNEHQHRDAELPYDQHFLHALVAPRRLLVTEAYEDHYANPPGSYAACLAARRAYELLGMPGNVGWAVREGGHAHTATDYDALLDFMDLHLHGREVRRDFQRSLYPQLETLLTRP